MPRPALNLAYGPTHQSGQQQQAREREREREDERGQGAEAEEAEPAAATRRMGGIPWSTRAVYQDAGRQKRHSNGIRCGRDHHARAEGVGAACVRTESHGGLGGA